MAKISAKGAVITINGQDLSKNTGSYEIEWGVQVDEVTGFTDGWKNNLAGIPVIGFTLNDVLWDKTAVTGAFTVLLAMVGTAQTCSIVPEAGGPTFSGSFFVDSINPQGAASSGAIKLGSVHFSASGATKATFA